MGMQISKRYSYYSFIRSDPNFMINKTVIREYNFFDKLQKNKILWHFEILPRESWEKLA